MHLAVLCAECRLSPHGPRIGGMYLCVHSYRDGEHGAFVADGDCVYDLLYLYRIHFTRDRHPVECQPHVQMVVHQGPMATASLPDCWPDASLIVSLVQVEIEFIGWGGMHTE